MTISYGFYNSLEHDRIYQALDFSRIFDGIINDGVFATVGNAFRISADGNSNAVKIDTGRAWFNGTWTYNDGVISLTAPESDVLYPRIDALVLEVDTNSRINEFKFVTGNAATNPKNPTLTNTNTKHQYAFAHISRAANSTIIRNSDITSHIGSNDIPFVTGILSVVSLDVLLGQWRDQLDEFVEDETADFADWYSRTTSAYDAWYEAQQSDMQNKQDAVDQWIASEQSDFLSWYSGIVDILDEEAAGHLQNEIDQLYGFTSGIQNNTVRFNDDGSIVETGDKGTTTVIFNNDGSITQTNVRGGVTKVTNVYFDSDGTIREVITT